MAVSQEHSPTRRDPSPGPSDPGNMQSHVHFDDHSSASEDASPSTSAMTSPLGLDIEGADADDKGLPKFPTLQHNLPPGADGAKRPGSGFSADDGAEGDSAVAEPFERDSSPLSDVNRSKSAEYEKVGDQGVCKMHKFSLYETASRYYIIGADVVDRRFRILKIDRTADNGQLGIAEDDIVYNKEEMTNVLNTIEDGNKATGGLKLKSSTWGLLGFIRFTGAYYMLTITKRRQVAMIGGHAVYQVDGTELVSLTTAAHSRFKADPRINNEEARFIGILNNLDLTRSFYFSYSYDITHTLQHNITTEREAVAKGMAYPHEQNYNSMFVWNSYLLEPAAAALKNTYDWCLPVIHGYIDQAGMFPTQPK